MTTRPTFEQECERDLQRALQFGKMFDTMLERLTAPKSNVIQFPARDGECANNVPPIK